jgi:1-acyl-sn-glycerol-3-phosphate acyltransferase
MCNHVSNLDPPVVLPHLPGRSSVLLKQELMRIPILGTAMRLASFIPVERSRSREAAQRSVAAAASALASGLHIIVFPEGTRSVDGRLSSFKKGPFFLARETDAPIIPVAIIGTREMLPKGSSGIHPGNATLMLQPPIEPRDYATREELVAAVRASIASVLPDEMKPRST